MRTFERVVQNTVLLALLGLLAWGVWKISGAIAESAPPPVEEQSGVVLRRLEIRLHEPLDKGRGDRYRLFECKEVPR